MENDLKFILRKGELPDLPNLMEMNSRWQKHLLDDYQNGFISSAFQSKTFTNAIDNSDIVVCEVEKAIVGYYLTYNTSSSDYLTDYQIPLQRLAQEEPSISLAKIGLGAQAVIEKAFQGKGIREAMLFELRKLVKNKYSFLLSKIARANARAWNGHTKDGWRLIDEDREFYYVLLTV